MIVKKTAGRTGGGTDGSPPDRVAGNRPGHEIEHPMALVILGGLATSTLMNLLVMPALYRAFGNVRRPASDVH